jgi:hypothetical protein
LEVWFAGVHSDVGGSYPEPQSQLSKLALRWMVCGSILRADDGSRRGRTSTSQWSSGWLPPI